MQPGELERRPQAEDVPGPVGDAAEHAQPVPARARQHRANGQRTGDDTREPAAKQPTTRPREPRRAPRGGEPRTEREAREDGQRGQGQRRGRVPVDPQEQRRRRGEREEREHDVLEQPEPDRAGGGLLAARPGALERPEVDREAARGPGRREDAEPGDHRLRHTARLILDASRPWPCRAPSGRSRRRRRPPRREQTRSQAQGWSVSIRSATRPHRPRRRAARSPTPSCRLRPRG